MLGRRSVGHAIGSLLALLGALASGCSRPMSALVSVQRPSVQLTGVPERIEGSQATSYAIRWSGSAVDGVVSHYEYAIDPPTIAQVAAGRETTWVRSQAREFSLEVARANSAADKRETREFRTFVVRAVAANAPHDSRFSEPLVLSFDALTVAPVVQILSPLPSALLGPSLVQPFDIRWRGQDLDGSPSTQPSHYRYKLFRPGDSPGIATWLADPDSLRRFYAPTGFAGWDSLDGSREFLGIDGESDNESRLFVIVAFDETGAYSPHFSLTTNMLQFRTAPAGGPGPTLYLSWGFGSQIVRPPQYHPHEFGSPSIRIPAGQPIRLSWYAVPAPGTTIKGYRWAMDLVDPSDDTMRENEATDWWRWSLAGLNSTSGIVGPLQSGFHELHIEVTDNAGRRSGFFQGFSAFDAPLNHNLLVVDDTRLTGDSFLAANGGQCLRPYPSTVAWPTAAELDTFLYARGNVPWRGISANCPPSSSAPVLSPPGLLAGYAFDTLGTQRGFDRPSDAVPLQVLAQYRHVIWMVDGASALLSNPLNPSRPMTALRHMSQSAQSSVLQAYIALGGRVWLVGAGGPLASLIDHNSTSNDAGLFGMIFSSAGPSQGELVPGRMMHDQFHWKSELIYGRSTLEIQRSASAASHLPPTLRRRTAATDAIPPTRSASAGPAFYLSNLDVAYLTQPNSILEDVDPDPLVVDEQSTLDTLYSLDGSTGALFPPGRTYERPVMTYYRGPSNAPTVLSGFAIWDVARPDAQALVDFVLGDLWGMSRQGGSGLSALRSPDRLPIATPAPNAGRAALPGRASRH